MTLPKTRLIVVFLIVTLLVSFLFNIVLGQVSIPISDTVKSVFGWHASKETWDYIIVSFRVPKACTAMLVGIGLSVAGLLMQTLFRNPLAGPDVLGLSSGSSLGVAVVILGSSVVSPMLGSILQSSYSTVIAACAGSFFVLLFVLTASKKIVDTASILIIGLLFSSFTSAIISILTYFSTAEELQKFMFWSLGSLGNLTSEKIIILFICTVIGLLLAIISIKSLDSLLLGENYAKSVGIDIKKSRHRMLLCASILVGSCTAFVGPIAFIGLAVPHAAKLLFQTSKHKILLLGTALIGANALLLCDTISQMPGFDFTLPINAITSIFGAPIVIWLVLQKKKLS